MGDKMYFPFLAVMAHDNYLLCEQDHVLRCCSAACLRQVREKVRSRGGIRSSTGVDRAGILKQVELQKRMTLRGTQCKAMTAVSKSDFLW